jgi:DNA-binding CsgD family transcriptional regulator
VLRGRADEQATLNGLLLAARAGRSAATVVTGEAGIGKTALLDDTVTAAEGFRVLRIAGTEAERELPFAALHQLCEPVFGQLDRLPVPQRTALSITFGLRTGATPEPFLVALAVLTLLSEVAEERPLLCVIDDAQWLDEASTRALAFVGRRLLAESIVMLFGVREAGSAPARHLCDLPELRLSGLRDNDARALLASVLRWPLDADIRETVLAEARGNPLALLELPVNRSPVSVAGGFRLPEVRHVPERIEASFLRRIEDLPGDARLLLLLAAADPLGDATMLWRAAARLGLGRQACRPLEAAGLLRVGPRVLFRHTLVRSAAYRSAASANRLRVHRALAEVTSKTADPDRHAWHRAHATAERNEVIAGELAASAGRAQRRGGIAAAAAFLEQAAELTADRGLRADRQLAAAHAKYQAGSPEAAAVLLAAAGAGPADPLRAARISLLRGQMAFASATRSTEAPRLLLETARQFDGLDVVRARQTYLEAFAGAVFAGRFSAGAGLAEVAAAARQAPPPGPRAGAADLLLDGLALLYTDGWDTAVPLIRRALVGFRRGEVADDNAVHLLYVVSHAAHATWDDDAWQHLTERNLRLARDRGKLAGLTFILYQRLALHLHRGDISEAATLVDEVDAVGVVTGDREPPVAALAVAAWRGDDAEVSRLLPVVTGALTRRGQGAVLMAMHMFTAVLHNGRGRYSDARAAAEEATTYRLETGFANWALVELVEAAARCGDRTGAERALARLTARTAPSGSPWGLGVEARSRALLAEGAAAEALYREAIDQLSRCRGAFALARAHLLYGEWLRAEGRAAEALGPLETAHKMFESFGAEAFTSRAGRELALAGAPVRSRGAGACAALTAQERQIARRARDGQSNTEIGAELFLSGRTVEWHLRKVFAKLGISSRRELTGVLSEEALTTTAG